MNYSIIIYIIGWILKLEAAFMLLPGITAIIYREKNGFVFLITMALCLAAGIPLTRKKAETKSLLHKRGFVLLP